MSLWYLQNQEYFSEIVLFVLRKRERGEGEGANELKRREKGRWRENKELHSDIALNEVVERYYVLNFVERGKPRKVKKRGRDKQLT